MVPSHEACDGSNTVLLSCILYYYYYVCTMYYDKCSDMEQKLPSAASVTPCVPGPWLVAAMSSCHTVTYAGCFAVRVIGWWPAAGEKVYTIFSTCPPGTILVSNVSDSLAIHAVPENRRAQRRLTTVQRVARVKGKSDGRRGRCQPGFWPGMN